MESLLLETITLMAIEVSLVVEKQVREKFEEADRLRFQQVEKWDGEIILIITDQIL